MKLLLLSLFFSLTAASCEDKYPDLGDGMYAEIITTKGTMVVKLEYDIVPITVANFVSLAEGTNTLVDTAYTGNKFYNGLKFHRVIANFMIQGGDPLGTGSGNPGYKFKDEFSKDLKHDKKGILAMANSGYGTNGSQFYITHKETPWLDAYDQSGNLKPCNQPKVSCHAVFGEVITGIEIVDLIEKDDVITEVNIIRKGAAAKAFKANDIFKNHFVEAEKEAEEKDAKAAKLKLETQRNFDKMMRSAEKTASGLQYVFTEKGSGPKPKIGNNVKLNYSGYLADGSLIDSSKEEIAEKFDKLSELLQMRRGGPLEPMVTPYSTEPQLISGFKEGMLLMKVGDKATFFIPPHLAWGERGAGSTIPPNSSVVFELELIEIVK